MASSTSRLWAVVAVVAMCVLALAAVGAPARQTQQPNPCVGTVTEPPNGSTLLTIQGVRFTGDGVEKTHGMLLSVGPEGEIEYAYNGTANGRTWVYDVDPLSNGNVLLVTTEPGVTVVEELNTTTGERAWVERFPNVTDAHDADLINGDELLLADKGEGHERILAYDRSQGEVVWQWNFSDHYNQSAGGPPNDWTHVNDVDKIGDGRYLVSVRNFDQAIVVNRSTNEIEHRLGGDDDYDVLNEQHNPQYLESENGTPTLLVADSENDRVVEYALENGSERTNGSRTSSDGSDGTWTRTWTLTGPHLVEPRDADRLPNGNTLIADRLGQRILEVTPTGDIVWEFYAPWQPYDAERAAIGDEPGGPTMRDLNRTGSYELSGSAGFDTAAIESCYAALTERASNASVAPAGAEEFYTPSVGIASS